MACMVTVISQVGVPAEGMVLVLGFLPLIELVGTMVNVTGDGAVTYIVAKSENGLEEPKAEG